MTISRHLSVIDPDVARTAGPSVMAGRLLEVAARTAHRVELAGSVRRASPLLLDALSQRGLKLGDVLDRLDPAGTSMPSPYSFGPKVRPTRRWTRALWTANVPVGGRSAPLRQVPGERLHLFWNGSQLDLRGSIGRLRLSTAGTFACLEIDDRLPETLAMAMVGRPVGDLIDHPLLTGRGYSVISMEPDPIGASTTMIVVRAGARRCRTPWTPREALNAGSDELAAILKDLET